MAKHKKQHRLVLDKNDSNQFIDFILQRYPVKIAPSLSPEQRTMELHIAQLRQAWKTRPPEKEIPRYNGVSITINLASWRKSHPDEFPVYCGLASQQSPKVHIYSNRTISMTSEIVQMLVDGEVTISEFNAFVTELIKDLDAWIKIEQG